jgi:hypothetical protein
MIEVLRNRPWLDLEFLTPDILGGQIGTPIQICWRAAAISRPKRQSSSEQDSCGG